MGIINKIAQESKTVEELYQKRFSYWDKNGYWALENQDAPEWYLKEKRW